MRQILDDGEHVITAYAQSASGPGWANSPLWIIVQAIDGTLRQECLQPDEQTKEMYTLYNISQAAHEAMKYAVTSHFNKRRKDK